MIVSSYEESKPQQLVGPQAFEDEGIRIMTVSTPTPTTRTINLRNGLDITVDEYGKPEDGSGALVLHGGAGPRSVAGFAAALAQQTYVIVPTHPGFDGTPRPETTDSVADLAVAYLDLIDEL